MVRVLPDCAPAMLQQGRGVQAATAALAAATSQAGEAQAIAAAALAAAALC